MANVDIAAAFPNVKSDEKITQQQSLAIWSVVAFVVIMVIVSLLGSKVAFLGVINAQIGVLGLMIILWIFVIAFRTKDKKPLLGYEAGGWFFHLGYVDVNCSCVADFQCVN